MLNWSPSAGAIGMDDSRRAWRTLAPVWDNGRPDVLSPATVERLRPLAAHTDRNSDAEYAFYGLPGRFQCYAEECLFADERILAFVPWSAAVTESRRHRLARLVAPGGRSAREGVLVVTDRHVLLLRDDAEVVGGGLAWGYQVRATTPERLIAVNLAVDARECAHLRLVLAAGGTETVACSFLPVFRQGAEQVAALLHAFLPRRNDRRLRRPGRIALPERFGSPSGASLLADDDRLALDARLDRYLADHADPRRDRRRVHAAAVVPGARAGDAEVVAVTQAEVIRVRLPGPAQGYPLPRVTSVELRRSVLGWHLAWTIPGHGHRDGEHTVVPFPALAGASCLAAFAALRQALTLLPVEAAGAELDVADETEVLTDGGTNRER